MVTQKLSSITDNYANTQGVRGIRLGKLDLGPGMKTPESAMTLNEELFQLRQKLKLQEKEIRRLKKENDFLEEASAFFAASRLKSVKTKE